MPHFVNPIVSIIIPVYNGMPFIDEAIESVRRQSYPHWELVICDNSSTDGTVAHLCQKFEAYGDKRLRLMTHADHVAMVPNWNRSLQYARHGLVKMLPSDDILLPECLELQVRLLQENSDVGFVTSGKEFIDASGKRLFTRIPLPEGKYNWSMLGARSLYAISNLMGEPAGILFRTELLKDCGIFNPDLKYYLDLDLWLRFLKRSTMLVPKGVFYQFRLHGNSISASSRRVAITEYLELLEMYEEDLRLSTRPLLKLYLRLKVYIVVFLRQFVFWLYTKKSAAQ
jgi:glycosyltransferase involved in cell wall biosynthesis